MSFSWLLFSFAHSFSQQLLRETLVGIDYTACPDFERKPCRWFHWSEQSWAEYTISRGVGVKGKDSRTLSQTKPECWPRIKQSSSNPHLSLAREPIKWNVFFSFFFSALKLLSFWVFLSRVECKNKKIKKSCKGEFPFVQVVTLGD